MDRLKTTNGKAFEILLALASAKETGRLGFAIAKQRRLIEAELTEFITIRNNAISSNSADGMLTADGAAAANAEIAGYLDMPCEFPVYSVSFDVFTGGDLASDQMYLLDFMVEAQDGE